MDGGLVRILTYLITTRWACLALGIATCVMPVRIASGQSLRALSDTPRRAVPIAASSDARPVISNSATPAPRIVRPPKMMLVADVTQPETKLGTPPARPAPSEDATPTNPTREADQRQSELTDVRSVSVVDALETPGSITFRKTPLQEVIFMLSDLWSINIVAGEGVSGDVSGVFHQTPLREVLSSVLSAGGYGYRQSGDSLIVLPIDDVGTDSPEFVSQTLPISAGVDDPDALVEAAKMLLSARGQMQPIGDSNVLIIDLPDRVERVASLFREVGRSPIPTQGTDSESAFLDTNASANSNVVSTGGIAYFSPQYINVENLAEPLQAALGDLVVVAVFPEENRVMVKGSPADLRVAEEALKQLDVPRPQVRITALIYDVGLRELEQLGVRWSRDFRVNTTDESPLGELSQTFSSALSLETLGTDGVSRFALRTLSDNFDATAFLEALDSTAEAKLLADPSITTGDRHQASIRIVQRIPVIAANPVDSSGVVFSQVEFEDAGVILNVTPRISRDGTIELKVQPEYSVVVDFIENNPVIDQRTADTTVRIANGNMFVLGGLRQKTVTETVRGVPLLQDIKYLGRLFRSHDTEVRESELIVFLRPEIVTPYYQGTPREQVANCVSQAQLGAIAHASCSPQSPCCHDANCPNHFPRPRINGGSRALEMLGGYGMDERIISEQIVGEQVVGHPVVDDSEMASPSAPSIAAPLSPAAATPRSSSVSLPQEDATVTVRLEDVTVDLPDVSIAETEGILSDESIAPHVRRIPLR
ncbi:MAG: secretin N-terminal domain-containing protein [Planctomycetota bacterium]